MNKKIAITGHTGILGKGFLQKFKNYKFVKCKIDISNKKKVFNWIKNNKFNFFFHFAAIVPVNQVYKNKKKARKVNFTGTKNIVDAIIKYKKNDNIWFFYSSTSHIYKSKKRKVKIKENDIVKPINYYGFTKVLSENYIINNFSNYNIKYCIGRIFSFTHPEQSKEFFIPNVFNKILEKKLSEINFKNINTHRDFISVKDILSSIQILFKLKKIGIYNIASGKPVNLRQIVYKISVLLKNKKKITVSNKPMNSNLIGDISKMKKLNFIPNDSIDDILKNFHKIKYKKY